MTASTLLLVLLAWCVLSVVVALAAIVMAGAWSRREDGYVDDASDPRLSRLDRLDGVDRRHRSPGGRRTP